MRLKSSCKHRHNPFVNVISRINFLFFKIFTQLREFCNKGLPEEFQSLNYVVWFEFVKQTHLMSGHEIIKQDKTFIFRLHIQENKTTQIRHSLDIPNVCSQNTKRLQNSFENLFIDLSWLCFFIVKWILAKGSGDIVINDEERVFLRHSRIHRHQIVFHFDP